jgi:hypothetical protein
MGTATAQPPTAKKKTAANGKPIKARTRTDKKVIPWVDGITAARAELVTLINTDISTPKNAPEAGTIFARMMLFDFIVYSATRNPAGVDAKIERPDKTAAVTRAVEFFKAHQNHQTTETYLWGGRFFSELVNCLNVAEFRETEAVILLGILKDTIGVRHQINNFNLVVNRIYECVDFVKAYNFTINLLSKRLKAPELELARIPIDHLIVFFKEYNRDVGENILDIDRMQESETSLTKKRVEEVLDHTEATMLSALWMAYVDIYYRGEA